MKERNKTIPYQNVAIYSVGIYALAANKCFQLSHLFSLHTHRIALYINDDDDVVDVDDDALDILQKKKKLIH